MITEEDDIVFQTGSYKPPFPWFGGKSRVAHLVWDRFGDVPNYVEPFFGSGAVLFLRPHEPKTETVNDKDCYVANFWRAVQQDPDSVAHFCDWPVNEADLHARHLWLIQQTEFRERMLTDPDYCDAKIAGWWVWGISQWIGGEWCRTDRDRVKRQRPHLGDAGHGVHRKRPHLTRGHGVHRRRPHLGNAGVHRKLPHLRDAGHGVHRSSESDIRDYLRSISGRLRRVRVCAGGWKRVLGPSPTHLQGETGIFLDPPYSAEAGRDPAIYAEEDLDVAAEVREWAIANGSHPLLRIALCGYEGEHEMPPDWKVAAWTAHGGYAKESMNRHRERIWFSPHCLPPQQPALWDDEGGRE